MESAMSEELHLTGLTEEEVNTRRAEFGENVLRLGKPISPLEILVNQFKSVLIYVILFAGIISLVMGEVNDFFIIMAVVAIDLILGFNQEYQTSKTYESLKGLVKPTAIVIRGRQRLEINARELVPGDIVLLNAGDKVPADGEVLNSVRLTTSEAILTGESEGIRKKHGDMTYMGTTVVAGHGTLQVTLTGARTELGKIASSVSDTPEGETPLQRRLEVFGGQLTKIVLALVVGLFIIGVLNGRPAPDMIRIAIILAIAAIPEALPIAVTVILVHGMKRVLKRHGLVKRLLAVETLGSVTVICSDKTGTLTEGIMRVTDTDFTDAPLAQHILALNNNLEDSLEASLWEYAANASGVKSEDLVRSHPRLGEEPFSSETKYMKTLNRLDDGMMLLLKGAPEAVLRHCAMADADLQRELAKADDWAARGLKLIGLAAADVTATDDQLARLADGELALEEYEATQSVSYRWVGLVGIEDPVRASVPEAVRTAAKAGIHVKMITGDHRLTALKVAREIGLDQFGTGVIEGHELETMDDATLRSRVHDTVVFSRISPHQKLRIVAALQAEGEVVAMLGDGVNDAPALKKSDIGVVVGTATEVAKETADLVLLDSDFATIIAAVEEGRVAFQNIKKVTSYTLSNSFAEIALVFTAMMLGWPAPIAVAQILWVHLICDGPVDISLAYEPKEEGIMAEPPRPVSEPILGRFGMSLIAVISLTAAAGILFMFRMYLNVGNLKLAQTIAFETLSIISLVYVFAYRSMSRSIFNMGSLLANKPLLWSVAGGFVLSFLPQIAPGLGNALGVVHLTLGQWGYVFGLSFALLVIVEVGKLIRGHKHA